mgnify:FL=1
MEPWTKAYNQHIHSTDTCVELVLGKQRKGGFHTDLGAALYEAMLECIAPYATAELVTVNENKHKMLYAGNTKLDCNLNGRILFSAHKAESQASSSALQKVTNHIVHHAFFDIELKDTHELTLRIRDMAYARKHSCEFIIGMMLRELGNLLTAAS